MMEVGRKGGRNRKERKKSERPSEEGVKDKGRVKMILLEKTKRLYTRPLGG
jgi:hypothetical protein